MKSINIKGQKFNRLLVIEKAKHEKDKRAYWKCQCDCGNIVIVAGFKLRSGWSKSCGCLLKENNGINCYNWSGVGDIMGSTWYQIVSGAKQRNIELSITKEDIWELYQKQNGKCALSGIDLKLKSKYNDKDYTASLDRIDSRIGYVKNNIQWVHKQVNMIKQSLTNEEFCNWCELIYLNKEREKLNAV